jgi:tetratricopeptide (TPR) repeat protein
MRKNILLLLMALVLVGAVLAGLWFLTRKDSSEEFVRVMNVGKNYYDKGEIQRAIPLFQRAVSLQPTHPDAHLNLANAYLLADQSELTIRHAREVLALDPESGAAHYLIGCAHLRLGRPEEALKALQQAKEIDRTVNAVSFQLGRAHQQLGQLEEALEQFQEVVEFEPDHGAAYYNLSQVLIRLGRQDEAAEALEQHQQLHAGRQGQITDPALYERSKYTLARAPFQLEEPDPRGIKITFTDATAAMLGADAANYHGPAGVLDLFRDGRNSLFVGEARQGFRLLLNTNGTFQPFGEILPSPEGAQYQIALVGDLNNNRAEDVILLGSTGSQVFRFTTNGAATDISAFSQLRNVAAEGGALADLAFTGNLGLLVNSPDGVRFFRNLGSAYFSENTTNAGIPQLLGVRQIAVDDWNHDELLDLFVAREGQPPLLLTRERGGPLTEAHSPADWPVGHVIAVGDINNDLRTDLVVVSGSQIVCVLNGIDQRITLPIGDHVVRQLYLIDYDNDGWLDIITAGDGLRIWRNLGSKGFRETTAELGLNGVRAVQSVLFADFDQDGDTDMLLTLSDQRLMVLRNEGSHANHQLKLRLEGTRSNASGIGVRVEVTSGGLRIARRVNRLPVEIGVAQHEHLDAVTVRWFDLSLDSIDVKVEQTPLVMIEYQLPTGSCPYLYVWDGERFQFVTDLLGTSPLGLPLSDDRLIEADTEEYVGLGNESHLKPRDGAYLLQITEELREVLYLDEAKLVAVDHPPDVIVHTTGKLRPGKPFPPHTLRAYRNPRRVLEAERHDGLDVTTHLQEIDRRYVSPAQLRSPQLRGLAEPFSVTLDFGPLPVQRPLALLINGWLRFGGGMANVAGSHDPNLPFPFPTLEVQTASGEWQKVDVLVGAPAGKTKSIVVDLEGKLPPDSARLRLSTAFEIHWDQILLAERADDAPLRITRLEPDVADLHWRGFSEYKDLPWDQPLTPDYEKVVPWANWLINVSGWSTRYGDVSELLARRDNALVLINAGDELTLSFNAARLPEKPPGHERSFFIYTVGWDKDADFHVRHGWTVEPLPFHGMDDQLYGKEPRPAFENDDWIRKYNTRWVGPRAISRAGYERGRR